MFSHFSTQGYYHTCRSHQGLRPEQESVLWPLVQAPSLPPSTHSHIHFLCEMRQAADLALFYFPVQSYYHGSSELIQRTVTKNKRPRHPE